MSRKSSWVGVLAMGASVLVACTSTVLPAVKPGSPTASDQVSMPTGPGSTPTPTPNPCTPDAIGRVTVHGVILDSQGRPVEGTTVTGKDLNGRADAFGICPSSDTMSVPAQPGAYTLGPIYPGSNVVITVSKPGYRTREGTIVPMANLTGDPNTNRLDFGGSNPQLALEPETK